MRVANGLIVLAILALLGGCHKKDMNTLVDQQVQRYQKEQGRYLSAYAVDEERNVYMATHEPGENSNHVYIDQYAFDGIKTNTYDLSLGTIIDSMAVKDGVVYMAREESFEDEKRVVALYSYTCSTGDINLLHKFTNFPYISQLVLINDRIYILGLGTAIVWGNNNTTEPYSSNGELLLYYSLVDGKIYKIGVENPISIALGEENTLLINTYIDDKGYCILDYNPTEDSLTVMKNLPIHKFREFAVVNDGKDVIYRDHYRGNVMLLSSLDNIEEEVDLYYGAVTIERYGIKYYDKNIYLVDEKENIVKFGTDSRVKKNETLTYITTANHGYETFGAGYKMNRIQLDPDQYALKVLSGDKDYDLSVMGSYLGHSYNIKKNGAYYPLNEVQGIMEYLDACFPYVKDVAINDNGDVWMIPVQVDIPGLLVKEDRVALDHVDIKEVMTLEEYCKLINDLGKENNHMYNSENNLIYLNFFQSVFNNNIDFNSSLFKDTVYNFKLAYENMAAANKVSLYAISKEFYYDSLIFESMHKNAYNTLTVISPVENADDIYKLYPFPRLVEEDNNYGNCIFLTVNSNSNNIQDTLSYVESYIQHIMGQDEKPLFFNDYNMELSPFMQSIYDLYKDGEIIFNIDRDLYYEDFTKLFTDEISLEHYIAETKRKLDIFYTE